MREEIDGLAKRAAGTGTPDSVAELSCLERGRCALGCTAREIDATVDSGTSGPSLVRR